MPKQLNDVGHFMEVVSRPGVKSIKIKRDQNMVKFKAQTSALLYTLVIPDLGKAKKIETELKRKLLQIAS